MATSHEAQQRVVDLSTDALTRPTEEMWAAMQAAEPGMASAGSDANVRNLEAAAARIFAMEAAVLVASARLGNLVALLAHTTPGDHVLLAEYSHILWCEEWGIAAIAGLVPRVVADHDGALDPDAIERAIAQRHYRHVPRIGLVCLENTFDAGGGTILRPGQVEVATTIAHRHGVPVHVDGSRIFNAAVALGVEPAALVDSADSVVVSLSKGLSAPMGAILCGSSALVERARHHLRVLGSGGLHKLGIIAAAGLVALDTMVARLGEDHRRARLLAEGLAGIDGIGVAPERVETNIVLADVSPSGASGPWWQRELERRGVRGHLRDDAVLRLVTHRHIEDDQIAFALGAFRELTRVSLGASV